MSVRGIKLRVDSLENAFGINAARVRVVFARGNEDGDAAAAAARLMADETPIVVRFVGASVVR